MPDGDKSATTVLTGVSINIVQSIETHVHATRVKFIQGKGGEHRWRQRSVKGNFVPEWLFSLEINKFP